MLAGSSLHIARRRWPGCPCGHGARGALAFSDVRKPVSDRTGLLLGSSRTGLAVSPLGRCFLTYRCVMPIADGSRRASGSSLPPLPWFRNAEGPRRPSERLDWASRELYGCAPGAHDITHTTHDTRQINAVLRIHACLSPHSPCTCENSSLELAPIPAYALIASVPKQHRGFESLRFRSCPSPVLSGGVFSVRSRRRSDPVLPTLVDVSDPVGGSSPHRATGGETPPGVIRSEP